MYVNGQCVRRKEILLLATHVKVMKGNATKIVKEKRQKKYSVCKLYGIGWKTTKHKPNHGHTQPRRNVDHKLIRVSDVIVRRRRGRKGSRR